MARPGLKFGQNEIRLTWKRVAEMLVKANELHEGHWRAALSFGTASGFNAKMSGDLPPLPSVWVPVMGLSLIREKEPTELTVDAAAVNPASSIVVVDHMPGQQRVQ